MALMGRAGADSVFCCIDNIAREINRFGVPALTLSFDYTRLFFR
jgi:hypothetical protein